MSFIFCFLLTALFLVSAISINCHLKSKDIWGSCIV